MARSRIALLSRAAAIVFGDNEGAQGERGWLKGGYRKGKVVCLNSALYTAERDLFVGDADDGYDGSMRTQEGLDTQKLLAEVIVQMYPDMAPMNPDGSHVVDPTLWDNTMCHGIIVGFNDSEGTSEDAMQEVLWKCEDVAFTRWLEANPRPVSSDTRSFMDSIV